jgi:uncharacterized protein (DUF2062 family)
VGFGVFMGIVPIWGFQMLIAIAVSVLFRLNKVLVIFAANISIPPMIPIILYLSHITGTLWMGDQAVYISFSKGITFELLQSSFLQYAAGATTLAVVAGLVFGLVTYLLLKVPRRLKNRA